MTERLRLAFIGTGLVVSNNHWPAVAALSDDFEVVALVNRTREKADALADTVAGATGHRPRVYSDYGALFADDAPDAVSLGLPPSANPEVAQRGARGGLPRDCGEADRGQPGRRAWRWSPGASASEASATEASATGAC